MTSKAQFDKLYLCDFTPKDRSTQEVLNIALEYYDETSLNKHYMCYVLTDLYYDGVISRNEFTNTKHEILTTLYPHLSLNLYKQHHHITTPSSEIYRNWTNFKALADELR